MSKSLLFVVYVVNVLCMICSYFVFSMPYRVPLQGKAGGKRTLVILDDMVNSSIMFYFNFITVTIGHASTIFYFLR